MALLFYSCDEMKSFNGYKDGFVIWKSPRSFGGSDLKEGWCRYGYILNGEISETLDSCYKFNVGDNILTKK